AVVVLVARWWWFSLSLDNFGSRGDFPRRLVEANRRTPCRCCHLPHVLPWYPIVFNCT
ncbi:hypothetical protein U1Q18_032546, partial [Sarracenia purpurea var. burkii]